VVEGQLLPEKQVLRVEPLDQLDPFGVRFYLLEERKGDDRAVEDERIEFLAFGCSSGGRLEPFGDVSDISVVKQTER
jgi:hypothetical protein